MVKAIITGASSGLGYEVGKQLKDKNYEIINVSRKMSEFEDINCDLSKEEDVLRTIEIINNKHNDFDVLILNAGIMPLAKVGEVKTNIDNLFNINIISSLKIVNGLLEIAKKNKADIIFVGSTASLKGYNEHGMYCASKHAVEGIVKSLQVELKDEPVRVIGFHPGAFNSNLRGGVIKEGYMKPEDLAKVMINIIELPKSVEVSEIVINRKKV